MSKSRKHLDNLQRIQNVLDDKHEGSIQSGYTPDRKERKIGDRWVDSDGNEWEQRDGYYSKVTKAPKGMWDKCNDCDKPILDKWDKKCYNLYNKCHYCQVDFEAKLVSYPHKREAWIRLQQLQMMEQIESEMESMIYEKHEENKTLFDNRVANAVANENLELTLKKNK